MGSLKKYRITQAELARKARELLAAKHEPVPAPADAIPADAPRIDPWRRLMSKLDRDNNRQK